MTPHRSEGRIDAALAMASNSSATTSFVSLSDVVGATDKDCLLVGIGAAGTGIATDCCGSGPAFVVGCSGVVNANPAALAAVAGCAGRPCVACSASWA